MNIKIPNELYLNNQDYYPDGKVIWKGASPSMFKSKGMLSEDKCTLVPNEIKNLKFISAFGSMGRNISYVLSCNFGEINYELITTSENFKEIIQCSTVINGEFQGQYKIVFDGQVYSIVKVESEYYNNLLENIKKLTKEAHNAKVDKSIENKRKRLYTKEKIAELSRGDIVIIDGSTKAIFLGDFYCGYAKYIKKNIVYYAKKQYPFLVIKDDDSEFIFNKYKGKFISEFEHIEKIGEENIDNIFNIITDSDQSQNQQISRKIINYCRLVSKDSKYAFKGYLTSYCQLYAFAYSVGDSKEESMELFKENFTKFITEQSQSFLKNINTIV